MNSQQRELIRTAVLLELGLTACGLFWISTRNLSFSVSLSFDSFGLGLLGCLCLLLFNYIVFNPLTKRLSFVFSAYSFLQSVVVPLSRGLDLRGIAIVALMAGLGEEIFFRGALEGEFGFVAANVAFSLMHFGHLAISYPVLGVIYFIAGLILSIVKEYSGGLAAPIIAHIVFDFVSLVHCRRTKLS